MLKTECPAAAHIDLILNENGYNNGCNRFAWAEINELVKHGSISAWNVFNYGLYSNHLSTFPAGSIAKSIQLQTLYLEIQERLCDGCGEDDGTTSAIDIWNEIKALSEPGRLSTHEIRNRLREGHGESRGITSAQDVWNSMEALIRQDELTAEDIKFLGAFEHCLATSKTADDDGDC